MSQQVDPARDSTAQPSRPSVSVVVCAYTEARWDDLQRGYAALLRQTFTPVQILLVIDHNPELLARAQAAFPAAQVLPNTGPRGLSGARNTGVAAATADVVAFLDDDAEPADDWLDQLTRPYADPAVIGTGGAALPVWPVDRPDWMPAEFDWVVGCSYVGLPAAGAAIRNPIGANMSFRRSVFDAAGAFTAGIGRVGKTPLGCEETEFSIRAAKALPGTTVRYAPEAVVRHRVSDDRVEWRYFVRRCFAEGLSKRVVSRIAGADEALSSERSYVARVLPKGVAHDLAGKRWKRAGAIVAGLGVTAAGYGWAMARSGATTVTVPTADGPAEQHPVDHYVPVQIGSVELATGVPELKRGTTPDGRPYGRARTLVLLHGVPVGVVWTDLTGDTVAAAARAQQIHDELAPAIREQLVAGTTGNGATAEPTVASLVGGLGGTSPAAAPTDAPLVSVVLCTRGRPDSLPIALDALLTSDYPNVEIVVVDNSPEDGLTAALVADRYADEPRIRLVAEPRPGLSRARNRGLATARGDIVAFTDDDVVVDSAWLRLLAAEFADPAVACVTGLVEPVELDTLPQWWFECGAGFGRGVRRVTYRLDSPPPAPLFPYQLGVYGTGASMALRRSGLPAGWTFDEALGAGAPTQGGEDIDLFLDVVISGKTLVYQPAALSFHRHRADDAGLDKQMRGYGRGLTALLAKRLLHRPDERRLLLSRVAAGVRHAVSSDFRAEHDVNLPDAPGYPRALRLRELLGMLEGPAAYRRGSRAGS